MTTCPQCGCNCQTSKISPDTRRIQEVTRKAWAQYTATLAELEAEQ